MAWSVTRRTFVKTGISAATALPLSAFGAWGQAWPSRPIKIIVAYPVGGLADLFARAYGEFLSQKLGQPVVIENKPGASGSVGAQAVKVAPADGYTLLMAITATLVNNRVLFKSLPYDADKDFVLIANMPAGHLPFVAAKATGATNVKEFVEFARKNRTNVGTWGAGSYAHIAIAEMNKQFGLQMEAVHYRGVTPMWQDFNAGVLQAAMGAIQDASKVIESGAGKAIAVQSTKRSSRYPEVATFIEQGVTSKAFDLTGYVCLVGPTGIPQGIVERLSELMVEAGKSERVRKMLDTFGIDGAARGHVAFKKMYDAEKPVWIEVVSGLGLTPQ